jgi:hypothetical protein
VERGAEGTARCLRGQVGRQGRDRLGVVAGVVGELDSDRFGGALGNRPIQLLDGPFGLNPLVETDKSDALREAWNRTITFIGAWNRNGTGQQSGASQQSQGATAKLASRFILRFSN